MLMRRSEARSWAMRLCLSSSKSSSLESLPRRFFVLRRVDGRLEMRFCSCPLRMDRGVELSARGRNPLAPARRDRLLVRGRLLGCEGELPGVMMNEGMRW